MSLMQIRFGYVVIGACTAGCVMASRLEAGSHCGPASMSSANNLDAIQLLGSSVDRATDWNYETMLPYLKRSERVDGRNPNVRGAAGSMRIEEPRAANPLAQAQYQAAVEKGYPELDDGNGSQAEGVAWLEQNVVDNKRQSAADAYLRPAMSRPNLTVVTEANVPRLVMDGNRCCGAQYWKDGQRHVVRSVRDVTLCAGTIGSPKILMLSGICPAKRLREHAVDVHADLAGVGENLHDHPISWAAYGTTQTVDAIPSRQAYLISRSDAHAEPDIYLHFVPAAIQPRRQGAGPGFSILFALARPSSRGSLPA
jgi:choline dehydrogenase